MADAPAIDPNTGYYGPPYSVDSLTDSQRAGLIAITVFAFLSVIVTTLALIYIGINRYKKGKVDHGQFVILISNLLLADTVQALSFTFELHWIIKKGIFAPDPQCRAQGALLNLGDVSSGLFVFSIAIYTAYTVHRGSSIRNAFLWVLVAFIWLLSLLLTVIGPGIWGGKFFTAAGNWCWISPAHEAGRLGLHYIWVFWVEFGTLLIYLHPFVILRRRNRLMTRLGATNSRNNSSLRRVEYIMVCYPVVYVLLTLPLATARMISYAGHQPPNALFLTAGALLATSGSIDALLYGVTRRLFRVGENQTSTDQANQSHPELRSRRLRLDSDSDERSRKFAATLRGNMSRQSWSRRTTVAYGQDLELGPLRRDCAPSLDFMGTRSKSEEVTGPSPSPTKIRPNEIHKTQELSIFHAPRKSNEASPKMPWEM